MDTGYTTLDSHLIVLAMFLHLVNTHTNVLVYRSPKICTQVYHQGV